MTKSRAKLPSLPVFEENPFIEGVGYNQRRKTEVLYDGKQAVIHNETGEVLEDHLSVARVKMVDSEQFVKLYVANLHLFFELGKPAQRVAEFVLSQIGRRAIGRGEVVLAFWEYERFFKDRVGGTRTTWQRGLAELAAKNLIAKSPSPNLWWINPAVAFNGDRARFITEIRRKKQSRSEELEEQGQQRLALHPERLFYSALTGELVTESVAKAHQHQVDSERAAARQIMIERQGRETEDE